LPDGLELDGYSEDGVEELVITGNIQWARDIQPFFLAFYIMVAIHLFYYFTGNLAAPMFASQTFTLLSHMSGSE
jgi:hypothetical protein